MGLRLDAIVEFNKLAVNELSAIEAYSYALSLQDNGGLLDQLKACLRCHLEQFLSIAVNVHELGGRVKTEILPEQSMLRLLKNIDDNLYEVVEILEQNEEQRLATYFKLATNSNSKIASLSKSLVQSQDAAYCRIQDLFFKTSPTANL